MTKLLLIVLQDPQHSLPALRLHIQAERTLLLVLVLWPEHPALGFTLLFHLLLQGDALFDLLAQDLHLEG